MEYSVIFCYALASICCACESPRTGAKADSGLQKSQDSLVLARMRKIERGVFSFSDLLSDVGVRKYYRRKDPVVEERPIGTLYPKFAPGYSSRNILDSDTKIFAVVYDVGESGLSVSDTVWFYAFYVRSNGAVIGTDITKLPIKMFQEFFEPVERK